MAGAFTYAQRVENRRFLELLAESGNARLSARTIGRRASTMHHRRSVCAAFAQEWEAAVAAAHARFFLAGGRRGPEVLAGEGTVTRHGPRRGRGTVTSNCPWGEVPLRTSGGEAVVVRTRSGKLQMRFAQPDKLTPAAEQAFLAALSATCNVRLSAAAAGASQAAFYRRRRQSKAFAREWRLALKMGWQRLEAAMLAAGLPDSGRDDQWRASEPPPIPPLSADQALQLLFLHQKSVELAWDKPHRRRRRGEPWEIYRERLGAMWTHEKAVEAEEAAIRRAARFEETGEWRREDERAPPPLPPLELVTGWSRASGEAPHRDGRALFGGWRMEEMEARLKERRSG